MVCDFPATPPTSLEFFDVAAVISWQHSVWLCPSILDKTSPLLAPSGGIWASSLLQTLFVQKALFAVQIFFRAKPLKGELPPLRV